MTTSEERALHRIRRARRKSADVIELARVASLAVRMEPHLLRALRLELVPHLDVGTEADLWFSPLIESRGPTFAVLDPAVAAVLRADLSAHRSLLARTRTVVLREHAYLAPSLQLEEELLYLELDEEVDSTALGEALVPALRTLVRGGEQAEHLAHWALRALPRLPRVLETANGVALALAAQAMVGPIVERLPETELPLAEVRWVIPPRLLETRTSIFVDLTAAGLRFAATGPPERELELPETTPLLVEVEWSRENTILSRMVQVEPGRSIDLASEGAALTLRTLAGDEYRLEPREDEVERPVCYVIQAFGKKRDPKSGRTFDLDRAFEVIRRVVEGAGYACVRADHFGPAAASEMFEMLLAADLVIADLTASTPSTLYELGVRHALRPSGTLLVTDSGYQPDPIFETTRIISYPPFEDLDGQKALVPFEELLAEAIEKMGESGADSPLYATSPDLPPPRLESDGDGESELSIEMLPAGHSSSVLLSWGRGAERAHLLADTGPPRSYRALRERLTSLDPPRLELFVITHIDDEALGGALRLLDEPDIPVELEETWFNGWRHLGSESEELL